MRSFLPSAVLFLCLVPMNTAFSQNDLPPANPPAGPEGGPGGPAGPAGQPGALGGQPGAATDPAYQQQVSYALGRNFANQLKESHIECDVKALLTGINDTLTGAQPKWNEQQLEAVLQKFGREMQAKEMARMQNEAAKNKQDEADFLAKNGKVQGVQTTPSGLQYRVIQQGQGATPTLNDTVKCNYRGTLIDGTEFDASARHGGPAEFPVKRVIPGWTEALQKMHVGDKWQLFVPSKLAYGMNPPPDSPIGAGSMLVFEIELLDVAKPQQ